MNLLERVFVQPPHGDIFGFLTIGKVRPIFLFLMKYSAPVVMYIFFLARHSGGVDFFIAMATVMCLIIYVLPCFAKKYAYKNFYATDLGNRYIDQSEKESIQLLIGEDIQVDKEISPQGYIIIKKVCPKKGIQFTKSDKGHFFAESETQSRKVGHMIYKQHKDACSWHNFFQIAGGRSIIRDKIIAKHNIIIQRNNEKDHKKFIESF